jgi:putative ABC transport system permease protein
MDIRVFFSRVRGLIAPQQDRELAEEVRAHLDLLAAEHERRGLSPQAAREAARRDFGGVEPMKEVHREGRSITWIENLGRDMRYAVRRLRKTPGVLALVTLALALGIGGMTAVFSMVDAALLRPLPYANAERLLAVEIQHIPSGRRTAALRGPVFQQLRAQGQFFSAVEGFQFGAATLIGEGPPILVSAPQISPGLLQTLGAVPLAGRLFHEGDAVPQARVALISEGLWTRRFGRAPDVIGRRLLLDEESYEIVGVLPARFAFPERLSEVWRPLAVATPGALSGFVQAIVMLPPDTGREAARARLDAISARLQDEAAVERDRGLVFDDLFQRRYGRQYSTALYAMFGAAMVVLLVACVNVTNLLLARAVARQSEFALTGALGASRARLFTQTIAESLALAAISAVAGWMVAHALLATFVNLLPPRMIMLSALPTLDLRTLIFAVCVATITCLAVGVLPALRIGRINLMSGLHGRIAGTADRQSERWQSALVVTQLALVLTLLTCAGLLLRSFARLINVDAGFDTRNLLTFAIQLPATGRYDVPGERLRLFEGLDSLVEGVPGVGAASFAEGLPPTGGSFSFDITPQAEGGIDVDAPGLRLAHTTVAPDYFSTMGIVLVEGRSFRTDDEDVVIVNDVLARRYWAGQSPVGHRFRMDAGQPWLTVVGVASDVKQMGLDDPLGDMELYLPYRREGTSRVFTFFVRTTGDHTAVTRMVHERLWTLDPGIPVIESMTMEERLFESVARPRFLLRLSLAFAALAMVLSGIGVYGTAAYSVTRRRREFAVRMAVGATQRSVLALVLKRGIRLAGCGCAIGLALSLMLTRLVTSLLFDTSPHEPVVLVSVTVFLAGLVMLACYVPAFRASRLDPARTLRES